MLCDTLLCAIMMIIELHKHCLLYAILIMDIILELRVITLFDYVNMYTILLDALLYSGILFWCVCYNL